MRRWLSAGLLFASLALSGCGAASYTPRPSPRIQVITDGGSLVMVKNGRSYPFGMFGGSLEEAVEGNPQAESEAHTYRTKTTTGFILSTLGSVTGTAGAAVLVGDELSSGPSNGVRVASLSMVVGGLALAIVGGAVSGSATPHLWNAINLYNDGLPASYPMIPGYPAYPGYPSTPLPLGPRAAPSPAPSYAPMPAPAPSYAPMPVPAPGYAPTPGYTPMPAPSYAPVPAPTPSAPR